MTNEPTQLHRLVCERCKKPIIKGQAYAEVRLPDGEKVPVHEECMK